MPDEYYRTIVEIEILSAGDAPPPADIDLLALARAIEDGPYSGAIRRQDSWKISRAAMAEALVDQASDPGFLIADFDSEDEELLQRLNGEPTSEFDVPVPEASPELEEAIREHERRLAEADQADVERAERREERRMLGED